MPSSSRLIRQQQHRVESKLYSQIVAEGSGSPCRIKVVGVGGGGGNAVNRMIEVSEGTESFFLFSKLDQYTLNPHCIHSNHI